MKNGALTASKLEIQRSKGPYISQPIGPRTYRLSTNISMDDLLPGSDRSLSAMKKIDMSDTLIEIFPK